MYANPFDGARAKIERSTSHFNELVRAEKEYGEEQPIHVEIRKADDGGTLLVGVADKLPGAAEATIVADILHNFRSSLDLAVSAASRIAGASDTPDTYFHFSSSEQKWDETVKGRMKHAPQKIRDVVRALKPWKDGNQILSAMNKLVSGDKHRMLVPTVGLAKKLTLENVKFEGPDGCGTSGVRVYFPSWAKGGKEANILWVEPRSQMIITGPVILKLQFAFGEVEPVAQQPIVPLLYKMGAMCQHSIELIEAASKP